MFWCDFGQGDQHEGALVHSGVRKRERWSVADFIAVKQEIKVYRARSVGERADTAEIGLDFEQALHDRFGIENGFKQQCGVVERGLGEIADWIGFIYR